MSQTVEVNRLDGMAKLERLVASLPDAAGLPGPWATPDRFRYRRGLPV